jgi:hypothetical protein
MRLVSLKIFCHKLQTNILEEMPTTPAPTCDPLIPHKEHPTNCTIFYHCEVGLDGPKYVEKSCGPTMYFNPISMVCDWPYAVEEIKPVCKGTSTTIQELPVEETKSRGDVAPVEAEFKYEPLCPPGTEEMTAQYSATVCAFTIFTWSGKKDSARTRRNVNATVSRKGNL